MTAPARRPGTGYPHPATGCTGSPWPLNYPAPQRNHCDCGNVTVCCTRPARKVEPAATAPMIWPASNASSPWSPQGSTSPASAASWTCKTKTVTSKTRTPNSSRTTARWNDVTPHYRPTNKPRHLHAHPDHPGAAVRENPTPRPSRGWDAWCANTSGGTPKTAR